MHCLKILSHLVYNDNANINCFLKVFDVAPRLCPLDSMLWN